MQGSVQQCLKYDYECEMMGWVGPGSGYYILIMEQLIFAQNKEMKT